MQRSVKLKRLQHLILADVLGITLPMRHLCSHPCTPQTPPKQCPQHSISQHSVQHRDSAVEIASNTAKSVCLVCF
ncbi:hypothetical protein NIG5292_02878 [Nereida ignava]|uniref:Uncharacterized protein n=1 Tax=Nereida ignava TaxID=282199 RepID=A0A0U1NQS9_9RHOB|nr:hypothetical protein NIG5292_02878 [Nereida ignava]SFJ39159.1 hypothetical protein SAMN02745667_01143 [Nereida ignava DSM 16309]